MFTNNKIILILLISLGLNIFLMGTMVGRHVNSKGISMPPPPFFRDENNNAKDEIREISREIAECSKQDIQKIKTLKKEVIQTLKKDPFDKAAAEKAFENLRNGLRDAHASMHEKIIEHAAKMPVEKRKFLLKVMGREENKVYKNRRNMRNRRNMHHPMNNSNDSNIHSKDNQPPMEMPSGNEEIIDNPDMMPPPPPPDDMEKMSR